MVARKCAVPSCLYRQRKSDTDRRSLFQCPKDITKARKWAELIPGIECLSAQQMICERHFETKYITRSYEKKSPYHVRSRLSQKAVPTIFPNDGWFEYQPTNPPAIPYFNSEYNEYVPTTFHNNTVNNLQMPINAFGNLNNIQLPTADFQDGLSNIQVPTTVCHGILSNEIPSTSPINSETSLQNVVKDLSASEQLLMNIKKEMLSYPDEGIPRIKTENLEDGIGEVKDEAKELTIYEQLENNLNHYAKKLPESWSVTQLSIGSDLVFAFSKECTVSENQALVVMYEKNIVLNSNGTVHYSIHGKTLENSHLFSSIVIKDTESLFNIISKFNEEKVCRGICTSEFEVDKDCTTYTDDLGYCRHINCVLLTDSLQCDSCYEYSQYLLSIVVNNTPVLNNRISLFL